MKKKINIKFNLSLKLFILIFLICICTLIGLIINSIKKENIELKTYSSNYISFTYDNNFQIIEEKDYIELITKDEKTNVVIKKLDYTNIAKEQDKYDLSSSLSYQVIEYQNDYIETYEGNEENIYYHLYENYNEKKQIEVINIFSENYIYIIIYSAENKEFDLYKESIDIIINSIKNR